MKSVFIEYSPEKGIETESDVYDVCPWACHVEEVDGGFMAFESFADFETWSNQQ